MNKLSAVVLLVVVLLLPALPAAANPPIPSRYFIDAEGLCYAPDGNGVPTLIVGGSTRFWIEKGGKLVMRCSGPLPDWAAIPKETIKLDYGTTGLFCAGKMKNSEVVTANYWAIVSPNNGNDPPGWVDIVCRFGFSPQDP